MRNCLTYFTHDIQHAIVSQKHNLLPKNLLFLHTFLLLHNSATFGFTHHAPPKESICFWWAAHVLTANAVSAGIIYKDIFDVIGSSVWLVV